MNLFLQSNGKIYIQVGPSQPTHKLYYNSKLLTFRNNYFEIAYPDKRGKACQLQHSPIDLYFLPTDNEEFNKKIKFDKLLVSQFNMVPALNKLIDKEIEKAKLGQPARIRIKINNYSGFLL